MKADAVGWSNTGVHHPVQLSSQFALFVEDRGRIPRYTWLLRSNPCMSVSVGLYESQRWFQHDRRRHDCRSRKIPQNLLASDGHRSPNNVHPMYLHSHRVHHFGALNNERSFCQHDCRMMSPGEVDANVSGDFGSCSGFGGNPLPKHSRNAAEWTRITSVYKTGYRSRTSSSRAALYRIQSHRNEYSSGIHRIREVLT